MTDIEERPRFYEGQYLGAADLTAAVDYGRSQLSRVLLAAHRWGIALGLDLVEVDGPNATVDVFVNPGFAWDGFGRPLLVTTPTKLPVVQFAQFDAGFVPGGSQPDPILVPVWLEYDEVLSRPPAAGFETCNDSSAFARVQESFRIVVGPKQQLSDRQSQIEVASRSMYAEQALITFDAAAMTVYDADIPQQGLPVDVTSQWLVPLGLLAWQPGSPGSFVKRSADQKSTSDRQRQYCGAVAGSIEANGGHVTVHDRGAAYSSDVTGELLWVEGDVRTDGDVHVYRGKLGFIASHAEQPVLPFQLLRTDDAGAGSTTLRLVIGDKNKGANRLTVGPETAPGTFAEELVVTDDGHVGVGISAPIAPLHIPAHGIQIGAEAAATDNFYLQDNTDGGPRGLRVYNGNVTPGGKPVAAFTADGWLGLGETKPSAALDVPPVIGIKQGALHLSGDPHWSSVSFNAHHKADNSGWDFDDAGRPAVTAEMDAIDGTPRFEVYATAAGNNQNWVSRLKVFGHTGDVVVGANGGSLGVGVNAPAARLDVAGDVQASGDLRTGSLTAIATDSAMRVVSGVIDAGGNTRTGTGFTVSKNGTGRWKITFTPAFTGAVVLVASRVFGDPNIDAGGGVNAGQTAVV
ncbi:MAG: hypothetical protein QOG80_2920, partial [Pseudonocardiales bacterium]|nr:hypothetical protein [Pseudonocardiales bacterium]